MEPTGTFLSVLPNLGIGVVSVLGLIFVVRLFVRHLETLNAQQNEQIEKRDTVLRELEREIRMNVLKQLAENSSTMAQVIEHLRYGKKQ